MSSDIHDLLVGRCDYQNGPGTLEQEAFYNYSTNGNLLEEKVSHSGGWLYDDYTYDQYGNVLSATNANGTTTYSRYSSAYHSAYLTMTSVLDGSQNVTTRYTYDFDTGDMLSQTDPNGYTTSYAYDALGRQTSVTYPAVNGVAATAYTYYYDGNNTMKTVDPDGHVTKDYFDGLARQTEVQRWNGSSAYSAEYYTYDWLDEVASNTTATGHTYLYAYDWDGRLVNATNPDGTSVLTSYDLTANTKTVTDENGHPAVYQYDWDQRLVSVKQYNGTSTYYLTSYSYDLSGNTLSVTDAKNNAPTYSYDDLNRLIQTTFPTSPATVETRTYDNVGNLLTRTTANGSTITYAHDALSRMTKVTYPGSGGTVTYTYDQDGNKLSMANPSATDYYSYDARDRLTNQTQILSGAKYQTLYTYDGAGDVLSMTYPDDYVLSMTYDGLNRLKTDGGFATIGYTLDDHVSKITYGDGEVQTYAYDDRARPTQILDTYQGTKQVDLNYTYDGTGNVLSINNENYSYDWLNRLASSSGPWGTLSMTYDQTGNLAEAVWDSSTTVYCYGPYNRLTGSSSSSCSSPTTSYSYDANGNLVSKSGGWTYSYDYANWLTKASYSGIAVQQDYYDGAGNRVGQVTWNGINTYAYDGLNIILEANYTGHSTTLTKRFYAGGMQVAEMVNSTRYYVHEDALGSTMLVTTGAAVKFSSNYVPYGMNWAVTGKEELQYTGRPLDSATGLYYMGARYYDPTTGRFVTEDSYQGNVNDPITLNRYLYARDNPMRYTDPTGHMLATTMLDGAFFPYPSRVIPTSTARTPTVTVVPRGTSAATPGSTAGAPYRPPDVALTESGDDQYGPTIGSGSSGGSKETQAWLVTIALGTTAADAWIIAGGLWVATVGTVGLAAPLTVPAAMVATGGAVALSEATTETAIYDWNTGPRATPQGAFSHFVNSAGGHALEEAAKYAWDWCAGIGAC